MKYGDGKVQSCLVKVLCCEVMFCDGEALFSKGMARLGGV